MSNKLQERFRGHQGVFEEWMERRSMGTDHSSGLKGDGGPHGQEGNYIARVVGDHGSKE